MREKCEGVCSVIRWRRGEGEDSEEEHAMGGIKPEINRISRSQDEEDNNNPQGWQA